MSGKSGTLFLLGSSHHTAPIHVREKMALEPDQMAAIYEAVDEQKSIRECLILNTCNRFELYGVSLIEEMRETAISFLSSSNCFDPALFADYGYWKTDLDVVKHLFRVAAGLDSQLIGETEIFGQVKGAYARAVERSAAGPALHTMFQKSFQAAKWARTNTSIGCGQVSSFYRAYPQQTRAIRVASKPALNTCSNVSAVIDQLEEEFGRWTRREYQNMVTGGVFRPVLI